MSAMGPDNGWQASFQPDCKADGHSSLREAFLAQRTQQALDALQQCQSALAAKQLATVPARLLELVEASADTRLLVLDDPVFAIWLRFFYRAWARGNAQELARHVTNLIPVLQDLERRMTGKAEAYVPGTAIAVECRHLHPYVMAATPPTYDFTNLPEVVEDGPVIGHPLTMEADLLGYAVDHIAKAWPDMLDQVVEFVRIIGYLPDATFRSCSAARYTGVVFLGNMDESILDLEESIIHETGHQVLYRVGEVRRLTSEDAPLEATYELPWSGSQRDLFGFLHAYYIYALLVKYYWRRSKLGDRYTSDCKQRAGVILAGSLAATPMLKDDPHLTEQARVIVQQLAAELEELRSEIRSTIGPPREAGESGHADAQEAGESSHADTRS